VTVFSNVPFDAIEVSRSLSVSRTMTRTDIEALTFVSGEIDAAQVKLAVGTESLPEAESVGAAHEPAGRAHLQLRRHRRGRRGQGCEDGPAAMTTRRQLVELDDDIATRVTVVFYSDARDARDALLKALME
jgi:hypothetical protein